MGLGQKLSDFRERQILEHAEPFLDEGEQVLAWVRTTRAHESSRGFLFITEKRLVVSWSKLGPDKTQAVTWDEIVSWGLASDGGRGPLLAVETEDDIYHGHILVGTDGMVANANRFLVHFVDKVPEPSRPLTRVEETHLYGATELKVEREVKTMGKHTRRVIVTIIGVLLVVVGIILLIAPGPGILVTFAGLAVLGSEYDWADDFLTWAKHRYARTRAKLKARRSTSS